MLTKKLVEHWNTNDKIDFNKKFVNALNKSTWEQAVNIHAISGFVINWLGGMDNITDAYILGELQQLDIALNQRNYKNAQGLLELIMQHHIFNV